MSDLQEKTEKLIQQAQALLDKAQASLDESEAFFRDAGMEEMKKQAEAAMKRATPAEIAKAERLAQERIDAAVSNAAPSPHAEAAANLPVAARTRLKKKRHLMV